MTAAPSARRASWTEPVETAGLSDPYAGLRAIAARPDETLLLFDARLAAYRAWHTRSLQSADGRDTSVLHGILDMAAGACAAANTRRWILVWDGSIAYKRAIFGGYKARQDRQRTPEELVEHEAMERSIRGAKDGLSELRVPQCYVPRIEADDAIGLLAGWMERQIAARPRFPVRRVVVVSDDKDFYQLLSPRVLVFRGSAQELVTPKVFLDRHGFPADRHADYKALVGEGKTGDNIPGVPSVGDVTAGRMIAVHKTLEGVIAHAAACVAAGKPKKVERAITAHAEQARMSYRLARIMRAPADLVPHGIPVGEVAHALRQAVEYGCRTQRPMDLTEFVKFCGTYSMAQLLLEQRRFRATCGFVLDASTAARVPRAATRGVAL